MGSHIGRPPYGYKISHEVSKTNGMKLRKLKEEPREQAIIMLINLLHNGCKLWRY